MALYRRFLILCLPKLRKRNQENTLIHSLSHELLNNKVETFNHFYISIFFISYQWRLIPSHTATLTRTCVKFHCTYYLENCSFKYNVCFTKQRFMFNLELHINFLQYLFLHIILFTYINDVPWNKANPKNNLQSTCPVLQITLRGGWPTDVEWFQNASSQGIPVYVGTLVSW